MDQDKSQFDLLVDQGWPAPGRVVDGGWVYRHAGGVTKRANSVLALRECADLPGAIDRAERFYAGIGQPCVFSIGMGATPGLDEELGRRGYRLVDPTLVMARPLTGDESGSGAPVEDQPSERWLRTWWSVDGGRHRAVGDVPARTWGERILAGVPAGYVHLDEVAVGRGVPQGRWLGVYCMAVEPHARRRGLGAAVLRTLLAWGRRRGATSAYLVVTEANSGARALYEREGFTVAGRYHYRVRP
ncbi:acetyltransferase [Microbispora rosea subsp. aerata]|nr:GNAT family N-acetyltransferase [Microbispora rosea]GGO03786.1 acetyltransferase [Microbispora rosea subsp. aerata]GIH54871.1 acetyltransferase [Microbispora rosea subsp. aerata]GLJ83655.1 acetyltransferase [Microbispora rosea subsp. aerata]